jgi:ribose transport system substrate-binding protein
MKVVVCIGDGGALGANQAVKSNNKATDDFGIFSVDGTEEACINMMNGDPIRFSLALGTPHQKAAQVIDYAARMLLGQQYDPEEYTPEDPVTMENVQEYAKNAGWIE